VGFDAVYEDGEEKELSLKMMVFMPDESMRPMIRSQSLGSIAIFDVRLMANLETTMQPLCEANPNDAALDS
jgi:hypothetical protein